MLFANSGAGLDTVGSPLMSSSALLISHTSQTTSAVEAFYLAMLLNPSVQSHAQAEIDALCDHSSRLPTFADKPNLPYTEAVLTELLRWSIVAPLGLAHRFTKEETYGEFRFPRESYAFANIG
jgi:cytochrome P450